MIGREDTPEQIYLRTKEYIRALKIDGYVFPKSYLKLYNLS